MADSVPDPDTERPAWQVAVDLAIWVPGADALTITRSVRRSFPFTQPVALADAIAAAVTATLDSFQH